jgi:hypothetical protein
VASETRRGEAGVGSSNMRGLRKRDGQGVAQAN